MTVPSTDLRFSAVNFLIYISDVSNKHGPFQYVPKSMSDGILSRRALRLPKVDNGAYEKHQAAAKSVVAPSGSLIIYGLDVFHRGTTVTGSHVARDSMTISYKSAGNDGIGFHSWQESKERNRNMIIEHASPEQLGWAGFPLPGSNFWNQTKLAQTRERWPKWNSSPYRENMY